MKKTATAVALVLAMANTAHAQKSTDIPSAKSGEIEEIVVTAERRTASAQKTAAAVSAITSDKLDKSVTNPQDISKVVPAISIASGGGGGTQVTIRGIGTLSGNSYAEQAVATNIDGVYIARSSAVNGALFDLERIEILKGPQGTLYGRNATAGAVNIITKKPTFSDGGDLTVEVGNYNQRRIQGAVNVALTDKLAVRVAGQLVQHDGYYKDGYDDADSKSLRTRLRYDASDTLKLNLILDYSQTGGMGGAGIISSMLDLSDPRRGPSDPQSNVIYNNAGVKPVAADGYLKSKTQGATASLDWTTDAGTLTVLPGIRHTETAYRHYAAGFPITADENSDTKSLEIRFATPLEKTVSYIVGAYGFKEEQAFSILADQTVTYSDSDIRKLDTDSLAAFAQVMVRLSDKTRLTIGARYSQDGKVVDGTVTTPLPDVPPAVYPVACPSPATYTTSTCTSPVIGKVAFSKTTWKLAIERDLTARNMVYANVGTGFKAGGFYSSLAPNTYQPENLLAYAIGSKNRFLGNKLQLNGEAYYWAYDDKQVTHLGPVQPAGYDLITENAGSATLYGIDVDLVWKPTVNDTLSAVLQYEHSRYDSFVYRQDISTGSPATSCVVTPTSSATVVEVDCSGHEMARAPTWSGTLAYSRDFNVAGGTVTFNISEKFESKYWLGDEQIAGQQQEAYNMTDMEVSYSPASQPWTLSLYGNNLEDVVVRSSSFVQPVLGQAVLTLRPPRTYGVRLSARF